MKTQAETARILGVARSTVEGWESGGSNDEPVNTSPPDRRLKLSPEDYEAIYERVEDGETQEAVAADFKISRQRVGQIVELVEARQREPEPVAIPGGPQRAPTTYLRRHNGKFSCHLAHEVVEVF